ncbi:hypothetical protein BAE44_0017500, partial [Dichanthelium oligosanthes]
LCALLLHPIDAYLEQELERRCSRLHRLCWDTPQDRRDNFLRTHGPSVRALITGGTFGADGECRNRGVRVTNTPGVLTDDMADLAVLPRMPKVDSYVCAGHWKDNGHYALTTRAIGPNGVLVNVGRGAHVDEPELIAALAEGRLGGAGLDVFEDEPDVPEALMELDNLGDGGPGARQPGGACSQEAAADSGCLTPTASSRHTINVVL